MIPKDSVTIIPLSSTGVRTCGRVYRTQPIKNLVGKGS
jgi:hypothetical protein